MEGSPSVTHAPVWRCLGVWVLVTTLTAIAVILGGQAVAELRDGAPVSFDQAVVALAGGASVLVCPWLWVLITWGVVDAVRGRPLPTAAGWWRRAAMVACGCATTVAVTLPAHASGPAELDAPTRGEATSSAVSSAQLLDGLPYPERPAQRAPSTSPQQAVPVATPGATHHTVRPGDTLWSITSAHLSADGTTPAVADVARAVVRLHEANRPVVGDDPDLILPGQRLTLDPIRTTHREDPR